MAKTKASNAIDAHVGSRVRMRRMMLGMSQQKLGDALGLAALTNRTVALRRQPTSAILSPLQTACGS